MICMVQCTEMPHYMSAWLLVSHVVLLMIYIATIGICLFYTFVYIRGNIVVWITSTAASREYSRGDIVLLWLISRELWVHNLKQVYDQPTGNYKVLKLHVAMHNRPSGSVHLHKQDINTLNSTSSLPCQHNWLELFQYAVSVFVVEMWERHAYTNMCYKSLNLNIYTSNHIM